MSDSDICLLEESVATALITWPLRQGWSDAPEVALEPVPGLTAEAVAAAGAPALLGSVDAALLLDRFSVVTDLALVSWHTGPIALWTPARPDEIDGVAVALGHVSRTAEALARATLHNFYGIGVTGWERGLTEGQAVIREGPGALQAAEDGELSDLVRAWFILSDSPVPTHVLVVPKALTETPQRVDAVVRALRQALEVGIERRREVRRDVADRFNLDRDRLVDFQNDQTHVLSKTARKGWLDLLRRTERALKLPNPLAPEFVPLRARPQE